MSIKIMSRVWAHSQQKGGKLLIMLALADFANDEGECWPYIDTLATKARLTDRQLQKLLPKLEQAREIKRIKSNGGRNRPHRFWVTVAENGEQNSVKKVHRKRNGEQKTVNSVTRNGELEFTRIEPSGTVNKNSASRQKRDGADPTDKDSRVKEFIVWFVDGYTKRFKERYHVKRGKDGQLIKGLLHTFDLAELQQRAIRLWESDDKFISGTDRGIGILASQINKLTGAGLRSGPPRGIQEIPAP